MNIEQFAVKYKVSTKSDTDGTIIVPNRSRKCRSHVYEYDDGLLGVMILATNGRTWSAARRALVKAGCTITQDGDSEGAATFDPSDKTQSRLALKLAACRKKRVLSPEHKTALGLAALPSQFTVQTYA